MDREKVTKPTAQIGFIKFVLTPMFESVAKVSLTFFYIYLRQGGNVLPGVCLFVCLPVCLC